MKIDNRTNGLLSCCALNVVSKCFIIKLQYFMYEKPYQYFKGNNLISTADFPDPIATLDQIYN